MTSLISQYLADSRYAAELIELENLELLYEAQTQGAIGVVFDNRLVDALKIPNLPILTINSPLTEHGIHSVRADHYQQGLLATEHCIKRGHRNIGFLSILSNEWGARERLRGYSDAMAAAGTEIDPVWIQSTIDQRIYDILSRWMSRNVTAILNFSEDTALEVLHFLGNILKLQIGRDISVISLEDLPIYQYLTPPQTTVFQPLADLARIAVETMLEICSKLAAERKKQKTLDICLPTRLIERDSVATLQ